MSENPRPPRGAIHGPFVLPDAQPHPIHELECLYRRGLTGRQLRKREIIHDIAYNLECRDASGKPCAICRVRGECAPIKLDLKAVAGVEVEVPLGVKWIATPTKQQRERDTPRSEWPAWIYEDLGAEAIRRAGERAREQEAA